MVLQLIILSLKFFTKTNKQGSWARENHDWDCSKKVKGPIRKWCLNRKDKCKQY